MLNHLEQHPGLSTELNNQIARMAIEGGADITKLAKGKVLVVQTKNTKYRIERIADEGEQPFLISGHPRFCPEPRRGAVIGSTFDVGGMIRLGYIGRSMRMEFVLNDDHGTYTTTPVAEVTEEWSENAATGC